MTLAPDDPRHGTESCYVNQRCRCDSCREAAWAAQRRRRAARPKPAPPLRVPADHLPDADGCLLVACRCGRTFRRVPVEKVRDRDWPGFECEQCEEAA